jgi:purine catabolism regulator
MNIPIRKLKSTSFFNDSPVLTGEVGLDNNMVHVNLLYNSDGYRYMEEHSFVIIGGHEWLTGQEERKHLVESLVKKNTAALGVYSYDFKGAVPKDLVDLCLKYQIPLFDMDEELSYEAIIEFFSENFYISFQGEFVAIDRIQEDFFECYKASKISCIAKRLWKYSGQAVYIRYFDEEYSYGNEDLIRSIVKDEEHWQETSRKPLASKLQGKLLEYTGEKSHLGFGLVPHDFFSHFSFWMVFKDDSIDIQNIRLYQFAYKALHLEIERRLKKIGLKKQAAFESIVTFAGEPATLPGMVKRAGCDCFDGYRALIFDDQTVALSLLDAMDILQKVLGQNKEDIVSPILGHNQGSLVFFLPELKDWYKTIGTLQREIKDKLGAHKVYVGLSELQDLTRAKKLLDQARTSLYWMKISGGKEIFKYENLGYLGLLERRAEPEELKAFADRYLKPLFEDSKSMNTPLYDTLKSYLIENSLNYSKTADDLYIHLNTVRYRIQQIEKILGLDLNEGADRFNLELAVRLHELLKL